MVILFTILYFTPGDPARIVLGQEVTQEAIANFRAVHGLDDPYLIQLGRYLYRALFHWDLGYSYVMKSPVSSELATRIPMTIKLAFWSVLFSTY